MNTILTALQVYADRQKFSVKAIRVIGKNRFCVSCKMPFFCWRVLMPTSCSTKLDCFLKHNKASSRSNFILAKLQKILIFCFSKNGFYSKIYTFFDIFHIGNYSPIEDCCTNYVKLTTLKKYKIKVPIILRQAVKFNFFFF